METERQLIELDAAKKLFDDIPPNIGMTGKCVQEMLDKAPRVDARCLKSHLCESLAGAISACDAFNKAAENLMPRRENIKTALVKLLYGHVPCEGPSWQEGGCPSRVHGNCGEWEKLSPCVAEHLAEYLIANSVTIEECNRDCANCIKTKLVNPMQKWIPVTERLPIVTSERRRSVLVTLEDRQGKRLVTTAKYNPEFEEWYEFKDSRYYDFKVLAWMPKPKRYEPPKEEAHGRSDC